MICLLTSLIHKTSAWTLNNWCSSLVEEMDTNENAMTLRQKKEKKLTVDQKLLTFCEEKLHIACYKIWFFV